VFSQTRRDESSQTLEMYRKRAITEVKDGRRELLRAFDTSVRRKPPVVAADAGPMGIEWSGMVL
jgi:hypothetical protein